MNIKETFDLCGRKARCNIARLADEPKSASFGVDGNFFSWPEGFYDIGNWTSSFHTGMALLAWRATKDEFFRQQVERLAPWYRTKVFIHHQETMHDLGFLYSLYSVALHKLTGDQTHREVGLRAAEVLANRFVPAGNYIRAWGRMDETNTDYAGLAIIDCMMNLPLLHWASLETGNAKYRDIAVRHADTTLKCFIRSDDSVYHAFRFDLVTGKPVRGDNYCGRDVDSHWARGTAWAIYGFALSYRYTRDAKYLEASQRVARKFLSLLDKEVVPVWDFRLPVGEKPLRDSSAASVAVCGLQELQKHGAGDAAAKDALLARLCSSDYINSSEACLGVMKDGQVGDGLGKAKNAYTSWGDYYLMEALSRELGQGETWW
jgi:unsaturated chondroitin disaccharide hydrolase